MRTVRALAALAALLGAGPDASAPASADPAAAPRFPAGTKPTDVMVCVNPLGKVDDAVLASVARGITAAYGFRARVLPAVPLPRTAFYKPRRRYKADLLLDFLAADVVPASGCEVVLGVT